MSELVDPDARDVVVVRGPDAASYLQSQVAQEVRPMEIGDRRWTLVLEPAGRVAALARLERVDDDAFELDTDAGFGDELADRLRRFRIRVDAEIEVRHATHAEPSEVVESRRIAAGWPRMGAEIRPGETIPASTGVVPLAVDFAKGCYPGQELVERMDSRGADAPTSLRVLDVADGSSPGDPVRDAEGAEVGVLTSVAGSVGLGYVRRGAEVGSPPAHLTTG